MFKKLVEFKDSVKEQVEKVSRESKGISNLAATLLLIVAVGAAGYGAFTWWQNSQNSFQNNVNAQQNSLFNSANNYMG